MEKVVNLDLRTTQLVDLFMSGLQWITALSQKKNSIRFSQWAKIMRGARGASSQVNKEQLLWLWEAISSEPRVHETLHGRLISFDQEWKEIQPIECAKANSQFGVFLKSFRASGSPPLRVEKGLKPDAEIEIDLPLFMKPGKARRLECCNGLATLRLRPDKFGPRNVEAAALKVDPDDVRIEANCIYVKVESLNHGYTTASLRLEPYRLSHGGRVYDHVALETQGGYLPLETIRNDLEDRLWNMLLEEQNGS